MAQFRKTLVLLCLCAAAVVHAQNPQRIVGPVQCTKDSFANTLTATFVSFLNGDDINHVYGCKLDNTGNECTYTACTFNTMTVNVGGVDRQYLTISSTVDTSVADPITDGSNTNACGVTMVTDVSGNRGFRWRIGLRREENFLWSIDNDYLFTCYEHQTLDTVLTNVVTVNHDGLVVNQPIQNPTVNMYVLRQDTVNGPYTRSSTCVVGENMRLEIEMVQGQYQDYLLPWGLYPVNTKVAPSASATSKDSLTDGDGCITTPNVLELDDGFARDAGASSTAAASIVTSTYRSGIFQCKRYLNTQSNELHFETKIEFCVGAFGANARCIDYCDFVNPPRRRRDVSNATNVEFDLKAVVTVVDKRQGTGEVGLKGNQIAMIVAISVSAGVILLALLVAFVVCMCVGGVGGKRSRKDGSEITDTDSRASSTRKIPLA